MTSDQRSAASLFIGAACRLGLAQHPCVKAVLLNLSLSTMAAQPPVSDASGHPLNHLGFIDTSVTRAVDKSCEIFDAGLDAAVRHTRDLCRPCIENIQRGASETARKAGHATKERTRSITEKVDPKVPRPTSLRDCLL